MFEKQIYPIIGRSSLLEVSMSHSLRCDSKQTEHRFVELDNLLSNKETVFLGEFLPEPLTKGCQPIYLQEGEGIPVINTLSIQKMSINVDDCRHISEEDFQLLNSNRILQKNDVLLTMDGGTSIGKPVLFDLEGEFTVDSHVAILRPKKISPKALVFLLASPIGQLQFQKFESGASGQTAVTEEDLRRFVIPKSAVTKLEEYVEELSNERKRIEEERAKINKAEDNMWASFTKKLIE
ncbi:restriction endonuclease subunit S [Shewanella vaxholmensis]|uniref:Restriction endonuclease subunit S n=1 Tax=Shewanella vaxholmensis TaxID=3063535 RepID=A0ABU9UXA6_9GAMM